MQFRVQGSRIYLLRSVYCSDAKRCRQQLVGKIDKYSLPGEELTAELRDSLTEDEQQEVRDWIKEKREKDRLSTLQWRYRSAGQTLNELAEVLGSDETPEITGEVAAEIHAGIGAIQKILKRSGWPKNKTNKLT